MLKVMQKYNFEGNYQLKAQNFIMKSSFFKYTLFIINYKKGVTYEQLKKVGLTL